MQRYSPEMPRILPHATGEFVRAEHVYALLRNLRNQLIDVRQFAESQGTVSVPSQVNRVIGRIEAHLPTEEVVRPCGTS